MLVEDFLLLVLLLITCYTDYKYQRIYNAVLFPIIVAALIIKVINLGLLGLIVWGEGILIGLLIYLIPYLLGGLGAGDVKLMAAVGALQGVSFVVKTFFVASILGGIGALALMIYKRRLFTSLLGIKRSLGSLEEEQALVLPYGIAISLGAFMAYWVI